MPVDASLLKLIGIGLVAGVTSGVFGIGGGLVIIPMLIYFLHFTQHRATGTSLAIMLPPIGLAATLEYWRHGNVDFRAAIAIGATMFVGGWLGSMVANKVPGPQLRMAFGVFVIGVGIYLIYGAAKRLGWF